MDQKPRVGQQLSLSFATASTGGLKVVEKTKPRITNMTRDMTLRWSCRYRDFLIWTRPKGILAGPDIRILDVWQMRDGDFITITNRLADLPLWFELHPTEVCGSLVYQMAPKVESGYHFREPLEGPNIWRLRAGDRLAWVGRDRPELKAVGGVLAILNCAECALAVGESNRKDDIAQFGSLSNDPLNVEEVAGSRFAVDVMRGMGIPREVAVDWLLGG